jgi:hypothetical protein
VSPLASLLLAASGTALLIGVAWALGFGRAVRKLDPQSASTALTGAIDEPAAATAVSLDGRTALARLASGGLASVEVMGADVVVVRRPTSAVVRPAPGLAELGSNGVGHPGRVAAFDPAELDRVLAASETARP